jgi:hypothetical protein
MIHNECHLLSRVYISVNLHKTVFDLIHFLVYIVKLKVHNDLHSALKPGTTWGVSVLLKQLEKFIFFLFLIFNTNINFLNINNEQYTKSPFFREG